MASETQRLAQSDWSVRADSRQTRAGPPHTVVGMPAPQFRIVGLDPAQLDEFWRTRRDHQGNTPPPFVDGNGGWPLRCCLRDSRPGDQLVTVAWSPFPWRGPYAESGPVVLHAQDCGTPDRDDQVPTQFHGRRQILRPYGVDRRIAYDHCRFVEPDDDLSATIVELLDVEDIVFIHARNVPSGCYSFTVQRIHSATN